MRVETWKKMSPKGRNLEKPTPKRFLIKIRTF